MNGDNILLRLHINICVVVQCILATYVISLEDHKHHLLFTVFSRTDSSAFNGLGVRTDGVTRRPGRHHAGRNSPPVSALPEVELSKSYMSERHCVIVL